MGAPDLIQGLRRAGFTLSVLPSGDLAVTPASKLTADERAAIKASKHAIVQALHCPPADREAIEERAAIMEYDGGLSRIEAEALAGITPDPDRHCWPHTTAMNTAEIDTFTARVLLFTRHGRDTTEAEKLADSLVTRDRQADDRRVCLECRNLRRSGGLWRCGQPHRAGWAGADLPGDLVNLLQRCEGFTS